MPDAQFDLVESYDTAPQSDWFHACRETGKPYVVVRTSERTADVMWDYVTLPPVCDDILVAKEGLLKEQAIAIFQKHASVDSSVRVKATIVFFDNLPIPEAKLAANELYALIESLVESQARSSDRIPGRSASLAAFPAPTYKGGRVPLQAAKHRGDATGGFELSVAG